MFNPPKSPWVVVAIEALVNINKSYLKVVVKDRLLHEDALHMLLLETDYNIDDLESLRPNHFLIVQSSPNTNFANIIQKKTLTVVQNGNQYKLSLICTGNIG